MVPDNYGFHMNVNLNDIGFYTYSLAAVAYGALSLYLLLGWGHRGAGKWLVLAALISGIWAVVLAFSSVAGSELIGFVSLAETLRGSTWIIFLTYLLAKIWEVQENVSLRRRMFLMMGLFLGVVLGLEFAEIAYGFGLWNFSLGPVVSLYIKLIISIIIFLLVENLYRNTAVEGRWGIRLLFLGVGTLFVYDFLMYSDSILFTAIGPMLYEARGLINFMIVPLIALSASRNPTWSMNVQFSRKAVFHTVTLMGSGAYLIGMAAAGYYLQNYAGRWGDILQVSFILVAFVGLLLFVSSGKVRATARVILTKHLFKYKYDYRDEWLHFIKTISTTGQHYQLRERVIQALADIMDCPGGALWVKDHDACYALQAKWNFPFDIEGELPQDDAFARFLEKREWVVNLDDEEEDAQVSEAGAVVPHWLGEESQLWLVLPLVHLDRLVGFVVLMRPRAHGRKGNKLDWESVDLLKIVGRQVASYLAEQSSEVALAETREFDAFNRKFAFVVHDIKNMASQLSMMVRNAEKHAHNPEFQKDMVHTVQNSVDKMNSLLSRIGVVQEPARQKGMGSVELDDFMRGVVAKYHRQDLNISYEDNGDGVRVAGDVESLETIFMHIIENAREACSEDDMSIGIDLSLDDDFAVVKVRDNGHGMSKEFIRDELFRPFRSTKANGYGIGAYESREMVRRLGGSLKVKSVCGQGTTMTVYLKMLSETAAGNIGD